MKSLSIILIMFSALASHAQDQLFKKDNSKLEVKILEISPTEIKYKLFTYQDGPTITILKSDVALVIYKNGTHEVFKDKPIQEIVIYRDNYNMRPARIKLDEDSLRIAHFNEVTKTKNLVSVNLLDVFNSSIGLSYLREFANNYLHVYAPISVGVGTPYMNQPYNIAFSPYNQQYNIQNFKFDRKTIEGGVGLHLQTSGKRVVTHFIGPYIGISQFSGSFDTQDNYGGSYPYNYPITFTNHPFVMNRYTFMIDNGFLFRITSNFNMMILGGIGHHTDDFKSNNPSNFANYNYSRNYNMFPINSVKAGMWLGYRF